MRRAVFTLAAVLTTTLAAAAPAAAGSPSTWYVGRPAPSQAAGGSCAAPDFIDIQGAIDASDAGDTIIVCDGVYTVNELRIEGPGKAGLTLKGATRWGATIRPGRDSAHDTLLAIEDTQDITVQHLRFRGRPAGQCSGYIGDMIYVSNVTNVDIRANRLVADADAADGGCGFDDGIYVSDDSTGFIRYNLVRNFQGYGILSESNDLPGTTTILGNSLQYRHSGDPSSSSGIGIYVHDGEPGKLVRVLANRVVGLATAGVSTPQLRDGILVESTTSLVRGNLVRFAETGLLVERHQQTKVRNNMALDNALDCASNGTLHWVNNTGDTSDPAGLCQPPAP